MKYLLLILVTVLVGCKTVDTPTPATTSFTNTAHNIDEDDKIPVPSLPPNNTGAVQTIKRVLCGPMKDILESMAKDYDEEPFATWQDSTQGYPVMLLLNKKTRTSTLLEYPGLRNDTIYHEKACILSVGINTTILEPSSIKTNIYLIEK